MKELEKYNEKFRMEILAYAMLIASEEGVIEVNQSHVIKAYKKVLGLKRLDESKIKWFIYISSAVLLSFAFLQISQIINSPQIFLLILPIVVILWVIYFCYIFRDFLSF
jgi:sterol desaturase/sphingolipid hydroxylase (fatty acid hydroxylase superfamily)